MNYDRLGLDWRGWKAVSRRIRARDRFCQFCGRRGDLSADHVVPLSKGGATTDDNLIALCVACNARKRDKVYQIVWWEDHFGKAPRRHMGLPPRPDPA